MLLGASAGGTIRTKNEVRWKNWWKNVPEYCSSDRTIKPKGIVKLGSNTYVIAQLDVILKYLAASTLVSANVSHV